MIIDWAYFMSYQTQRVMVVPFTGFGQLCGLQLTEEDFIGARDRIHDLLKSAERAVHKKVMKDCKLGAKEVRDFNTKFPSGPTYTRIPKGAEIHLVVRDVPAAADTATTLANIEAERQRAVGPLTRAIDAGVARFQAFVVEATIIANRNVQNEERRAELNRRYDEQRDADIAAAAIQPPEMVQADDANPAAEESEESGASSSDSSSSDSN